VFLVNIESVLEFSKVIKLIFELFQNIKSIILLQCLLMLSGPFTTS
jgi:hypothetical protein